MKILGLIILFLFLLQDDCGAQEMESHSSTLLSSETAQCIRYEEDGSETSTPYDVCLSFCCGGNVVLNSTNQECCGSIAYGSTYDPRFEHCCRWWTGHGAGIERQYPNERISCCGISRIHRGLQACCHSSPHVPKVYERGRDLCCDSNGIRLPAGVPQKHAKCCGSDQTYDVRVDSCPCNDGQLLYNVTASQAACCTSPEGKTTPYAPETQICCNGKVGTKGINFCCGDFGLGTIGDNVCCSGNLLPITPRDVRKTECCNGTSFDPSKELCCDNQILNITDGADQCCDGEAYNPNPSICCDGNLLNRATTGDTCCGGDAFFEGKGSFCCNGEILLSQVVGGDACCGKGEDIVFYFQDSAEFICCDGSLNFKSDHDSCCGTQPYNSETQICCSGTVFEKSLGDKCCHGTAYFETPQTICCADGPAGPFHEPTCCGRQGYDKQNRSTVCCDDQVYGSFKSPACCHGVGYDRFNQTCCRQTVLYTPNQSNRGRCCGDDAMDINTQLCCSGEIVNIPSDIPRSRAQCCEFNVFNTATQLCCSGRIREKPNPFTTKCCGIEAYNVTEQICCEDPDTSTPELFEFEFGRRNTGCCGTSLYNTTTQFCCDGFLEDKLYKNTECCQGKAYNRDEMICCEGNLQSIGNVPPRRAECCGDKCIYSGIQRCCNDRVYEGNALSSNTCMNYD